MRNDERAGTRYACPKFPRCSTLPVQLPPEQVRRRRFPRCYDHDLRMDVPIEGDR